MEKFKLREQAKNAKLDANVGIGIANIISAKNISANVGKIEGQVQAHFHEDAEEIYLILEGEGVMHTGKPVGNGKTAWETPAKVKEGDIFLVPKKTVHCLKNSGKKTLIIAFFSSPPFLGKDRIIMDNP